MDVEHELQKHKMRLAELTQKLQNVENDRNLIQRVMEKVSIGFEESVILTSRMPAIFDEVLASRNAEGRKLEMQRLNTFFKGLQSDYASLLNGSPLNFDRPLLLEQIDILEREVADLKKKLKKAKKNANTRSNAGKKRKQGNSKQEYKKDSGKTADKVDDSGS